MKKQKILHRENTSIRNTPINLQESDLWIFEHELERKVPKIILSCLNNIIVNPDGILFDNFKILPESFPSQRFMKIFLRPKTKLKLWAKNCFLRKHLKINEEALWITDIWSQGYFHWMTDALPRLLVIQSELEHSTLLLPGSYQDVEYIRSSLSPFSLQKIEFIHKSCLCKSLKIPSHTAPAGNYNEAIVQSLRAVYTDFYREKINEKRNDRVYISRSKAQKRKISNEEECIAILEEFGFSIIHFEDYPFEQQVQIVLNTKYLISNHGAGLTNMLFMQSGGSILELRQAGDSKNNCYFALASALQLNYFYQLCQPENSAEDSHTANLIVNCEKLRENLRYMLTYKNHSLS